VVASRHCRRRSRNDAKSQSPSLRGSGRFADAYGESADADSCLNPLHCGAVVASLDPADPVGDVRRVSIPFIAGQWSLRRGGAPAAPPAHRVSIPFIAGQWSLRFDAAALLQRLRHVSIPFIAGQWSLPRRTAGGQGGKEKSQSPSLRGSGRFLKARSPQGGGQQGVSIPFIAGQWSLPARARKRPGPERRVSIPFIAGQWSLQTMSGPSFRGSWKSLNPLHCGAVVASAARRGGKEGKMVVSIPFIAGQWSLHLIISMILLLAPRLNPLHCGAVVASPGTGARKGSRPQSLNPLHCGAVVAS